MPNVGVAYLNDEEALVAAERETRKTARRRSCVVNYYRRPRIRPDNGEPIALPGWLQWGDATEDARRDRLYLGYVALSKYGRLWDEESDFHGKHFSHYGPWAAILIHPEGPSEFPVEQIISMRWYDRDNLPKGKENGQSLSDAPCEACGQLHKVRFPQLAEHLKTEKIPLFRCPECNHRVFHKAVHLARHLRNTHDYEIRDLELLSKKTGIDFDREYRDVMASEVAYELDAEPENAQEPTDLPADAFEETIVPTAKAAATQMDADKPADGTPGPFGRIWLGGKQVRRDAYEKALATA